MPKNTFVSWSSESGRTQFGREYVLIPRWCYGDLPMISGKSSPARVLMKARTRSAHLHLLASAHSYTPQSPNLPSNRNHPLWTNILQLNNRLHCQNKKSWCPTNSDFLQGVRSPVVGALSSEHGNNMANAHLHLLASAHSYTPQSLTSHQLAIIPFRQIFCN